MTPLLDGATLRQLQRLRLRDLDAIVRGVLGDAAAGVASGGRGLEFADYRAYAPGDDLRRIDWNVYARLRQPFVRTSPAERELGLALLLDGSRSLGDRGAPARRHAERLAALLGAVALLRGATVQLTVLADGGAINGEPLSGEQQLPALLDQLEQLPRGRETALAAGIHARRPLASGSEFAALLTDALVPAPELDAALEALRGVRAATLLHVTEARPRGPAMPRPPPTRPSGAPSSSSTASPARRSRSTSRRRRSPRTRAPSTTTSRVSPTAAAPTASAACGCRPTAMPSPSSPRSPTRTSCSRAPARRSAASPPRTRRGRSRPRRFRAQRWRLCALLPRPRGGRRRRPRARARPARCSIF